MIYTPKEVNFEDYETADKNIKSNFNQLQKIDKSAKQKGKILYRYITQPHADGRAYYQIIKENKKTVRIKVCTGIGDDWIIPYWGEECSIDKKFATELISSRDKLKALLSKRG
jgi:hypothetical protein